MVVPVSVEPVSASSGAITLATSVTSPGTFSWRSTFPNGRFGVFAARVVRCAKGQRLYRGRCRPSTIVYSKGTEHVSSPGSVTLRLADEIDISRGDMFVNADDPPVAAREIEAMICWMSDAPMKPGGRYAIKHTTRTARAVIEELEYRVDVNTLDHAPAPQLGLNEIGRVHLRTSAPLMVDRYRRNRTTGSFILIDESTNDTVGAGMLLHAKSA